MSVRWEKFYQTTKNNDTLDRREIIAVVALMRRLRDRCKAGAIGGEFERGMAVGYGLSARMLWRQIRRTR